MTTTQTPNPRYADALARHAAGLHAGRSTQQQTASGCPACEADERTAYLARVDAVHGR